MQTVKEDLQTDVKRKIKSNPNAGVPAPKAMTKAYLAAEAAEREQLRSEFIDAQKEVRDAEISIPFVFYDGSNVPGGAVKVKKGEQIWLFLEKCRKLGAEIGVGSEGNIEIRGSKQRADSKKSWARIGVDDLMLIRGSVIIPHVRMLVSSGLESWTNGSSIMSFTISSSTKFQIPVSQANYFSTITLHLPLGKRKLRPLF